MHIKIIHNFYFLISKIVYKFHNPHYLCASLQADMHASELQPSGSQAQRCSASTSHIQDLIPPLAFPSQEQHHSLQIVHPVRQSNRKVNARSDHLSNGLHSNSNSSLNLTGIEDSYLTKVLHSGRKDCLLCCACTSCFQLKQIKLPKTNYSHQIKTKEQAFNRIFFLIEYYSVN